jgi:hypothetical protein
MDITDSLAMIRVVPSASQRLDTWGKERPLDFVSDSPFEIHHIKFQHLALTTYS